jgi:hypothetical protein
MTLWLPIFIYFFIKGGAGYALRATDWVIYTMVAGNYLKTVAHAPMYAMLSGFDHPLQNFLTHLEAGGLLLLVCGLMVGASRVWARAERFSFGWWLGLAITLLAAGLGAWLGEEASFWSNIGTAFNFSTIFLVLIIMGWCAWAAWWNRSDFNRALGLTVVGTAAVLMLARMILYGRIYHYGFFMAPLAVLFVVHLVVVEGARPTATQLRRNWLLPVAMAAVVLDGGLSLTEVSLHRYAQKTLEVGTGRDRFYTFQPQPAPGDKIDPMALYAPQGLLLKLMLDVASKTLPKARTLIAFPESAAINYHLRVPCPVPEVEFHSIGLGFVGPQVVADQLKANPPDAVFIYLQNMLEFGVPYFGYDEASGKALLDWVNSRYTLTWNVAPHSQYLYPDIPPAKNIPLTPTGDAIDLLLPNAKSAPSSLPSPEQLMNSFGP